MLKCCFTSTETVGLLGTGAQDVHLDFYTAPELCDTTVQSCFTSTETIDLLGTGAQDVHLDFNTGPELCVLTVLTNNDILFRSLPVLIPSPAHHCGWQVAGISGAIDRLQDKATVTVSGRLAPCEDT